MAARRTPLPLVMLVAALLALALPASAPAAPGDLDPSFGPGGVATPPGFAGPAEAADLAVRPDGRSVVVGSVASAGDFDVAVASLRADGTADTGFAGDGGVTFADPGNQFGRSVALLPGGDAVVAGGGVVRRVDPAGGPVTGFGSGGSVAGGGEVEDLAVSAQGRIAMVVPGGSPEVQVLRPDGTPDPSFNGGAGLSFAGRDAIRAAWDSAGRLLVVAAFADTTVSRFLPSGLPDPAFGTGGTSAPLSSAGPRLAVGEGRVLVTRVGFVGGLAVIEASSLREDGTPDPSYGVGGTASFQFDGRPTQADAITLDAAGRLVAVGRIFEGADNDLVALRARADGTLDPDFGTGGRRRLDLGAGVDDEPGGVALDAVGRILVAATRRGGSPPQVGVAARLLVEPDLCPGVPGTQQADLDGDGVGDACDPDQDGDGLPDEAERATGSDPRVVDSDGDGLRDGADACPTRAGADRGCPVGLAGPPVVLSPADPVGTPRTEALGVRLVGFSGRIQRSRLVRRGLRLELRATAPVRVVAQVSGRLRGGALAASAGSVILAQRSTTARSSRPRLALVPPRSVRRLLRRGLRLRLEVRAFDALGRQTTVRRAVRVR